LFEDFFVFSVESITGSDIIYGFVVVMIVVIIDPLGDPGFKLRRTIVIIQQDKVFHRAMIPFYFPLGHGMIGSGPDVVYIMLAEIIV